MTQQSAKQFALWLAAVHPALFMQVYKAATNTAGKLGDISDFFSSIGSGIEDAASSVGTFLTTPSNINALASVASNYFSSQASQANAQTQLAVLNAQAQRAQAGLVPAPVSYVTSAQGVTTPVYVPALAPQIGASGQLVMPQNLGSPVQLANGATAYPMSASSLTSILPGFFQQYGMYILAGGALLALLMFFRRA